MKLDKVIEIAEKGKRGYSFFTYVLTIASIAPTVTTTSSITFDQDSTFYWCQTTYLVDLAAAAITDSARPIPLIGLSITDTASGRTLSSATSPLDSQAGYKACDPFVLPTVRAWAPNSTLRAQFNNYSAATTYTNLFVSMHGIKVYN